MKCINCGFELEEQSKFCTVCGAQVVAIEPTCISTNADKILSALKDKMFLAICILYSIGTVLSTTANGISIIQILITVFLWLTYAKSLKNIADASHLRGISGCVYANYIINNVLSAIIIVCGAVLTLVFAIFADTPEFIESFEVNIGSLSFLLDTLPQKFIAMFSWLFGVLFIVVGALLLVFNLLATRKIHRFAKSVHMSVSDPSVELENPKMVTGWLIFLAVCSGILALSSLATNIVAAISTGCTAAVAILSVVLINKYFIQNDAQ